MQPIDSGSTTERKVRTSIVTVLAIFGAAFCFFDAYVRYPNQNLERAVKDLPQPPEVPPRIVPGLTSATVGNWERATLADLKARWGEPGWRQKDEARFFGPAGQLIVTLRDNRVLKSEYQPARFRTETDLFWQKGMGVGVGVAALALIVHWLRVMLVRTTMTDQGVKITGLPLVPFAAMTGLRVEHFAKKGWVDVEYATDGRTDIIRLDDYKIKAFPEIMEEICLRKGFENPHKKWLAEKAAGAAPPAQG